MTERYFTCVIGNGEFFPTLHIKVDKNDSFLYCITLKIILDDESVEICHCDNSHEKGHHIHHKKANGEEQEYPFEFKGFRETIDYFQNNWKELMEKYKNE